MYKLHDTHGARYEALGEIDTGLTLYRRGERMDLADVWPGKRTDIADLERNAAAFRREEHRRFFRAIGNLAMTPLRFVAARARKHSPAGECAEYAEHGLSSAGNANNFTDVLARTYAAALYRGEIPHKDYRDD